MPPARHLPSDLHDVQVHWQLTEGHVRDGVPRVGLAGEVGVGPGVDGEVAVEAGDGRIGERLI
jgi:hypothetical protein